MSHVNRPALDRQAFVDMIDVFCIEIGVPAYSEIADALPHHVAAHEAAERNSADLYAALRTVTEHAAAAQVLLLNTGLDQPRETLDRVLEEALERAAAGSMAGNIALFIAETRVDLDGRDDVTVLADARTRLRAAGRRL
ncbi:hypothetical protein [Methylobacterium mesophilicum]|uniref:hypothetical protein n=1 Tax=Methylobacterium mesophilicum TaxID=39956 RepID=UPI002F2C58D5